MPRIADPCKLLTQIEASAAVGAPLGPGELKRFGVVTRCAFYDRATQQEMFLDVQNEGAHVAGSDLVDSFTHAADAKAIGGIGDRAVWSHDKYSTFLYILKGRKLVSVGLPRTIAVITPAIEKAAKLIAQRI